jgi:hypothetical protein
VSQSLSVTEVVCHFAEYINRVAHRGECFVPTRGNKLIAGPRPLLVRKRPADLPALLMSLPYLFEREATRFVADLTAPREALAHMAVATCIGHVLTTVSTNVREFTRIPGLTVEVWGEPG